MFALVVLLGDAAFGKAMNQVVGRAAPHLAKQAVKKIPMGAIRKVNAILGRQFITKYGTKQGALVLSKQLPLGIGALIGGGGNAAFAYFSVQAGHKFFGKPPKSWEERAARIVKNRDFNDDDIIDIED